MEVFFATMFEDVRHEKSLKFLLSLPSPDTKIKQYKFTDHEIDIDKKISLLRNCMDREY